MVSCPFRVITCRLKELPLPHARKTILILGQDRGVPRERTADPPLAAGSSGTWCGKTYISTQDTCRPSNAVDFRSARRPESLYEDAAIRGEPPLAKKQLLPTRFEHTPCCSEPVPEPTALNLAWCSGVPVEPAMALDTISK